MVATVPKRRCAGPRDPRGIARRIDALEALKRWQKASKSARKPLSRVAKEVGMANSTAVSIVKRGVSKVIKETLERQRVAAIAKGFSTDVESSFGLRTVQRLRKPGRNRRRGAQKGVMTKRRRADAKFFLKNGYWEGAVYAIPEWHRQWCRLNGL